MNAVPIDHTASDLARDTAALVKQLMTTAGLEPERDLPSLHGDTTASGQPFITLGRLTPPVALKLARLAAAGARVVGKDTAV